VNEKIAGELLTNDATPLPAGPAAAEASKVTEPRIRYPREATRATAGKEKVESGLSGPEQRIVDAIAWMESIGVAEPEQTAVAFLAGYTIGGGAFNNPRGALRTKGLIEYRGDRLALTDSGRAIANFPDGALTPEELQKRVLARLPGPEQKILSVLLARIPRPSRTTLSRGRPAMSPAAGRSTTRADVSAPSALWHTRSAARSWRGRFSFWSPNERHALRIPARVRRRSSEEEARREIAEDHS
jgi:hypothetical protein